MQLKDQPFRSSGGSKDIPKLLRFEDILEIADD